MARRVLRLVAVASIFAFALSAHAVSATRASTDTGVADPPPSVVDAPPPTSDEQPLADPPPLPEPQPPEAPPEAPPDAPPPTPTDTVEPDPSSPPPADTAGGTSTDTVSSGVPPAEVPPAEVPSTDTVVPEEAPPAEVITSAPIDPPPADAPPADGPRAEVSATHVPPAETPPMGTPIVSAPPAASAVRAGRSVDPPVSASTASPRQDQLRAVAEPLVLDPAEAGRARAVSASAALYPLAAAGAAVAAAGAAVAAGMAVTNPVVASATVAIEFGRAGGGWAGAIVFNLWLRRQLRERRMSQRQLAALSGVDHSTISRLLRDGRHPSLATATKLVGALRRVGGEQAESDAADYFERMPEETIFPARRVEMALRADDQLDEAEVRRLMSIYLNARRKHEAFGRGPATTTHAAPVSRVAPASRAAAGSRATPDSLG